MDDEGERLRGLKISGLLAPYKPDPCFTALDIGCGDGRKASWYHCGVTTIGVENDPVKARSATGRLALCLCCNMTKLPGILPYRAIDWITMMDSLEHIAMGDALVLLEALKNIARRAITIFSPVGDTNKWPRAGHIEIDDHKSIWTSERFVELGFSAQTLLNYHGPGRSALIAHWRRPDES